MQNVEWLKPGHALFMAAVFRDHLSSSLPGKNRVSVAAIQVLGCGCRFFFTLDTVTNFSRKMLTAVSLSIELGSVNFHPPPHRVPWPPNTYTRIHGDRSGKEGDGGKLGLVEVSRDDCTLLSPLLTLSLSL